MIKHYKNGSRALGEFENEEKENYSKNLRLNLQNLIDMPGHPELWFKQYGHHSDKKKKKKVKRMQRLVSAGLEVCASSKGTRSRDFSPKLESKEKRLKKMRIPPIRVA